MQVMVSITLAPGDKLDMTPDEIAEAVLKGLNANPDTDTVLSNVQPQPETGSAGVTPDVTPESPDTDAS